MAAVRKKHQVKPKEASSAKSDLASGEPKQDSVVVSDTVTETTERIEVIEEVTPKTKSETETPAKSPAKDPLTEFKEKMTEEESPISDVPAKKNYMWTILFVVFLALAFLIGIFLYRQGMNKGRQVNVVTLSPTPTTMPLPTKAVDLSKYEIKVLNGSEIDGEAGRQKDNLKGEGFKVSSIGNAENSDYTKTIIQAKEDVDKDFLDKLKSVLEKSFVVGEIEELPQDADSDIIVIIGSETN